MDRPRLIRGLRIGVATTLAFLCFVTTVLLARSYFSQEWMISKRLPNAVSDACCWGLIAAVLSAIPWSWHYSLRTLLFATTLVAVALGIIVAAM